MTSFRHPRSSPRRKNDPHRAVLPAVLGLGELTLIDKERRQETGGRLDLLLSDDNDTRYEVELQLGATDERHIVRCIEYWDIERRRYPGYDHVAVLIAEDVTSRFLNVLGIFSGTRAISPEAGWPRCATKRPGPASGSDPGAGR